MIQQVNKSPACISYHHQMVAARKFVELIPKSLIKLHLIIEVNEVYFVTTLLN